ncbi:flagellin Hag [Salipaludibacillus agaradhaerens]|uniref:flagellin Hag n=1 Tax=Salipaludibacillus agaradhaerens TaxID=76935 RepID=UPI002151F9DD|nr:flagellin Hag [Salipaludibacillus agaradhaerens]MCR6108027.1 flagellin Hag [Salipaludibacillus agaradhaerens]MCR6120053.1 flagellin Hag [Salipaludibacillus agaradhaerens]UJW59104.1 flagellin Hag [Bacillus sp. A116_S68]
MIINNNMSAMNAHRQLGINQNFQQTSMEKLSSGLRINRAGDDAAGLSISEKMRAQIRGLDQASRNSQDGISLIQTAEGALDESHSILQRMRELVVQAGNTGTNEEADLQAIQDEIGQLQEELTGIANRTEFNGKTLLNGDFEEAGTDSLVFQIGANATQQIEVNIENMDADSLGDGTGVISDVDVTNFATIAAGDAGGFDATLAIVDGALQQVSDQRSALGSVQNRLEHTIRNLDNSSENLQAAESRIRDVDMAKEMMEFTKNNILSQASQSMLAQANQLPQSVLQLLG